MVTEKSTTVQFPQYTRFLLVSDCFNVQNAHFKNGAPFLDKLVNFVVKFLEIVLEYV